MSSRSVLYVQPCEYFNTEPWPQKIDNYSPIRAVRFALNSAILPLVTETLCVAETARWGLMSWYGRITEHNGVRGRSGVLSGKNERGKPFTGHRHAYYLPTDENRDGRLDHLTVCAADGFGPDEQRAFNHLRELRTGRSGKEGCPLQLLLLGMGTSQEYHPGPLDKARVWISATPYLATRYAKTRGRYRINIGSLEARTTFLQDDLHAQLEAVRWDLTHNSMPEVIPLHDENCGFKVSGGWRVIQFKQFRRRTDNDRGRRLAGAFRLSFSQPVWGPIALGWSSHFGMGLFLPAAEDE